QRTDGSSPPQPRRGGCAAKKKLRSHLSPRRRARSASAIARSLKSGADQIMIFLTSTTPAAATASAFPSSAEEGSCDSRVGQQPRQPWVTICNEHPERAVYQVMPPFQGLVSWRTLTPGLTPWAKL